MVCRLPLACLQSEHSKATANGCQPSHDSVGKSNQLNQNTQTTLQYLSPSPSGSTQKVSFPHTVGVWFSEEFSTFHCSAPWWGLQQGWHQETCPTILPVATQRQCDGPFFRNSATGLARAQELNLTDSSCRSMRSMCDSIRQQRPHAVAEVGLGQIADTWGTPHHKLTSTHQAHWNFF